MTQKTLFSALALSVLVFSSSPLLAAEPLSLSNIMQKIAQHEATEAKLYEAREEAKKAVSAALTAAAINMDDAQEDALQIKIDEAKEKAKEANDEIKKYDEKRQELYNQQQAIYNKS